MPNGWEHERPGIDHAMMKQFCQRDARWATIKLGNSPLTVGRFGCTTTCLCDISSYFSPAQPVTPDALAQQAECFTADGLINWQALKIPGMKFVSRVQGRNDYAIRQAIRDPNAAVMLQVNDGAHWVVALRPTFFGSSYIVADPWTGKPCDVIRQYRNITGAAFFRRA